MVLKIEKATATNTIGRAAARASVSGLGIQNRYGPDHEVVLATIDHTIYNRWAPRRTDNLLDLSIT
jgi:hypothetical protein